MTIAVFDLKNYENEITEVRKKYVEHFGLRYGWGSNKNLPFDQGHWNRPILKRSNWFPLDMSDHPNFIVGDPEASAIWDAINNQLGGGRAVVRAYINGYTYGTDGYVHQDDSDTFRKYGEDGISETVIVYLNDKWNINWAGETVVFDGKQEIGKAVIPKKNRCFVFDSHLWHAGRAVSRACTELRSVLVYKTAKKDMYEHPAARYILDNSVVSHSGSPTGNLFGHLWNVMRLLETNKFDFDTCAAALFHSAYGNQHFAKGVVQDRDHVKSLIGERAERLAWEFCQLKDRYTQVAMNLNNYSEQDRESLLAILWANALEAGENTERWEQHLTHRNINFADQKYKIL